LIVVPRIIMRKRLRNNSGLTLIELLITLVILSILATVGFGQYRTSQIKARDAQRKADLGNIARALEMYYNDHQSYPLSANGRITVERGESVEELEWGADKFSTDEVIYMQTLPQEPSSGPQYCYSSSDGSSFYLFSLLENENDPAYAGEYQCNGTSGYFYYVNSSNAGPAPTVSP